MRSQVGTAKIQGREVEVFADGMGTWHLKYDGSYIGSGDTLEKAKAAARKTFKKTEVKVEVPFIRSRFRGYGSNQERVDEYGIADGLNVGDARKVKIEINGKRDQINVGFGGQRGGIWNADTPKDRIERYFKLQAERNRIAKEQREIEDEFSFDLASAVRDAIERAAAEEARAERAGEAEANDPDVTAHRSEASTDG